MWWWPQRYRDGYARRSACSPETQSPKKDGYSFLATKPVLCMHSDALHPGGVGEHMLTLAHRMKDRYEVVLVWPPTEAGAFFLDRAAVSGDDSVGFDKSGKLEGETLEDWLRTRQVEIFHCHPGTSWRGHAAVVAARKAGAPYVVRTEHRPFEHRDAWNADDYKSGLVAVDRLICVSAGTLESFARIGVPAGKLRLIRNGVERPQLRSSPKETRARLGLPSQTPIVLTAGRLRPVKDFATLLEAIPAVVEQFPQTCLLVAGEGELHSDLRRRAIELGIDERVRFLGRRDDLPDLMGASDLFALTSLSEGLPLVVLEAMALGLPVVATRTAGIVEAVHDGVNGRLVNPKDPAALASSMLEVLEHPETARAWGEEGRALFERSFTAERMALETESVYLEPRPMRRPNGQ